MWMEKESAFIWMAQNDGVSRNNEAVSFEHLALLFQVYLSFRCKFFWDFWQMSLTFHVHILSSFFLEFESFKELCKLCCSNFPLHMRKLRPKVSMLSARINTSMQIFPVTVLKNCNATLGQHENAESTIGGYI